jgi:hypothetical protein
VVNLIFFFLFFFVCVSPLLFSSLQVPVKELLNEAVESSNGLVSLTVVDITQKQEKKWFFLYKHDIPVVHLDGIEIARHKLTREELAKRLS